MPSYYIMNIYFMFVFVLQTACVSDEDIILDVRTHNMDDDCLVALLMTVRRSWALSDDSVKRYAVYISNCYLQLTVPAQLPLICRDGMATVDCVDLIPAWLFKGVYQNADKIGWSIYNYLANDFGVLIKSTLIRRAHEAVYCNLEIQKPVIAWQCVTTVLAILVLVVICFGIIKFCPTAHKLIGYLYPKANSAINCCHTKGK